MIFANLLKCLCLFVFYDAECDVDVAFAAIAVVAAPFFALEPQAFAKLDLGLALSKVLECKKTIIIKSILFNISVHLWL